MKRTRQVALYAYATDLSEVNQARNHKIERGGQKMSELREVFADFALLGERPGLGLSVPLGGEAADTLQEGERVLLIEWGSLCAEGTLKAVESDGRRYWYGVLESRAAIREIDSEMPAPSHEESPTRTTDTEAA